MLFALLDYINYRRAKGRYGTAVGASGMAIAYRDALPKEVIDQLEEGDTIFTQRMDSIFSWGTMYFASSMVDHVAVYVGDGKVFHSTLGGSKLHSINAVAKGARILPARINFPRVSSQAPDEPTIDDDIEENEVADDGGFINRQSRLSHVLPPKLQLVWVAGRLMLGFYIDRYRWQFSADIAIAALLIDIPLYLSTGWSIALPLGGVALAATLWNVCIINLRKRAGRGYELLSHPDILWRHLHGYGGIIFTPIGPLALSEFGIMPLSLFTRFQEGLGLGGEGSDDGPDDKLEVAD